ncbi:hypothetical protein [Zobellella endophytica]|uniref:hypothetical protein n=1 Tax=Zobellella endophytica TaxID=2116700 RepID=UPI001FE3D208|nr:hypothetical protein [Zobellella endophytica]
MCWGYHTHAHDEFSFGVIDQSSASYRMLFVDRRWLGRLQRELVFGSRDYLAFADQAHFQRHFKRRLAITPGQYQAFLSD